MSDANWGLQDASAPKENSKVSLELFKSRSTSGFLIWHHGPVHWVFKCQSITAHSNAESKMYATDECTKAVHSLPQTVEEMGLQDTIIN
eukprot:1988417-Ditylum_brightwellii.AAC.1